MKQTKPKPSPNQNPWMTLACPIITYISTALPKPTIMMDDGVNQDNSNSTADGGCRAIVSLAAWELRFRLAIMTKDDSQARLTMTVVFLGGCHRGWCKRGFSCAITHHNDDFLFIISHQDHPCHLCLWEGSGNAEEGQLWMMMDAEGVNSMMIMGQGCHQQHDNSNKVNVIKS